MRLPDLRFILRVLRQAQHLVKKHLDLLSGFLDWFHSGTKTKKQKPQHVQKRLSNYTKLNIQGKNDSTCPPSAVASGDWQAGATEVSEIKTLYETQYSRQK